MTASPSSTATLSIPQLRADLNGRVIGPDDAEYDEARTVFFGGIDRRPAIIVRVADAADVAYVIALARETGLPLAVRSGGHSNGGYGVVEGGIVLDLRDMQALDIDIDGRTAWAQTGLTAIGTRPQWARMASPRASATPARWASAGSPWAGASGTWCASTALRSTASSPRRS